MKATLPEGSRQGHPKNLDGERVLVEYWEVAVYNHNKVRNPVTCRVWGGTTAAGAHRVATVWMEAADGREYSGTGRSSGRGIGKATQAISAAFEDAGIAFDPPPVARPCDKWTGEAMAAVTVALGLEGCPTLIIRG